MKYVYWIISSTVGLLLWFLLLVYIDDTEMWFFQFEGFTGDILRFCIFVVTGGISFATAYITNKLLAKVVKK